MGFDITAYDDKDEEIASMSAYMGAFRMLYEQGYDWFEMIGAPLMNGGCSGIGADEYITLERLEQTIELTIRFDTGGKLACNTENDYRDEFGSRKDQLIEFMQKCVGWCKENNKDKILIFFG